MDLLVGRGSDEVLVAAGQHEGIGDLEVSICEGRIDCDGHEADISVIACDLLQIRAILKFYIEMDVRCKETVRLHPPFPSGLEMAGSHLAQISMPEELVAY